jgi:hypothetical protein
MKFAKINFVLFKINIHAIILIILIKYYFINQNMNNWNIPNWLEEEIHKRDTHCIYCGVKFDKDVKNNQKTIEHIINDAKIINRENIALCCRSCNASKGSKSLFHWLLSDYCKTKNIISKNIAPIARKALKNES